MRSLTIAAATVGVLAAAIGFGGTAAAAPTGGSSATDAINQLKAQGYNVQVNVLNGPRSSLLSECTVAEVTGLSGTNSAGKPLTPAEAGTVNVDVNCPEEVS
jgi:hypothetical protein